MGSPQNGQADLPDAIKFLPRVQKAIAKPISHLIII
jgi:hypothetical protein